MTTPVRKATLNIACLQLNSQPFHLDDTLQRAHSLLTKWQAQADFKKPDIVVFSEFALTGYNFNSRKEILPYTETSNSGVSFELAKKISLKFGCYTIIGYPEYHKNNNTPNNSNSNSNGNSASINTSNEMTNNLDKDNAILYNSANVVSPKGHSIFNYRKSFLYDTDYLWGCQENPNGFQSLKLEFPSKNISINTSFGICMDLNPYKFTAPFDAFEFAKFNVDNKIDLIICPMSWLHSYSITNFSKPEDINFEEKRILQCLSKENIPHKGIQDENKFQFNLLHSSSSLESVDEYLHMNKPDLNNMNYWVYRLLPVIDSKRDVSVVFANRSGIEDNNTIFAGSSSMVSFGDNVRVWGALGKGVEGVLQKDVPVQGCEIIS
ncbi:hypothetical protein TBLA_0B01970 [Henningerozyma blattae CBS 6284]|uniref:CN hydrolase domain-containing protein n=1 Tax=Henningerozyma blattae (strain ATCC 34711 / CBS 6284 / DSM 70876 / NBRC 10599 / NRRL Y-10934 / UCD 77-7) TaxID=1071380 RepID=I2GY38_HENB6|nr:hypothetical protein TBLA_0B01970 [Tetrapisispora blattae CBS 6284]CCH59040.1 hypothetical protein TBLA_0B01970 [Tetrapisispora blattae CBS 6284]